MGLLASLVVAGAALTPKAPPPPAPAIAYVPFKYGKAGYHAVQADLNSGLVTPSTVYAQGLRPAWKIIGKNQPSVAITGTFFAPQNGHPVADVLVDGELLARGNRGSGIGISDYGTIDIFDKGFKRKVDWSPYRSGLRGAVRLMTNGVIHPNPKAQRFKDRRIWGRAARVAVGLTKHGKLLMVATKNNVTLSELSKAMKSRGVVDAVSLDGGSSACMYYKGKMIVSPSRKLSNMVVLWEKPPFLAGGASAFEEQKAALRQRTQQ